MGDCDLKFGLSHDIMNDFCNVFSAYQEIDHVVVFGSRAKNTFQDGSDIDLAVFAPTMSHDRFSQLWNQLDELPLIFKLDVLHWDSLGNQPLKEKILRDGRKIYPISADQ